jgi:uncharacterized membrane protein YvbJ
MNMKVCTKCGENINNYNGICTNCGTNSAKVNDAPLSRLETRKIRSKTRGIKMKRAMAVICILFVLCIAFVIIKNMTKHEPVNNPAANKTTNPPKNTGKASTTINSAKKKVNKVEKSPVPASADYILRDSEKKVLTQNEIAALSKEQVRIARNEIYARHGYIFKSQDLQQYFTTKPWYHADPTYGGALNKVELENIKILKVREEQL